MTSIMEVYESQPDFNIYSIYLICAGLYLKSSCTFFSYEADFGA